MITKPKKKKPLSYYRNKADRLLQEICRAVNESCLICGGEYSCAHHFIRKSQSTVLRYDMENCIPICHKCHTKCHTGQDDTIPALITVIKGKEWLDRLLEKKKEGLGQRYGRSWYKQKMEELEEILSKLG